jgi:hypothetical protein
VVKKSFHIFSCDDDDDDDYDDDDDDDDDDGCLIAKLF